MAFAAPGAAARTDYAAPLPRLGAAIIDGIIVGIIGGILSLIFDDTAISSTISGLIGLAYYAGMESSARQATFGKSFLGLIVTDLDGNRISLLRAVVRYFAKILSAAILLIGYIMILFTPKKQGLHDMIAGTLVLKSN